MLLTCALILALHGTPADCVKNATPSVSYTVQRNDTLRDLSVEFLGTRNRTELAHFNGFGTGHGLRAYSVIFVPYHNTTQYRLLSSKRQSTPLHSPARERIVVSGGGNPGRANPGVPTYSHYSCSRLESLWISQGGNPNAAFMAAEIAMAESGGNPNAISPTADYGLWQINRWAWGNLATLAPIPNARAAIRISANGSNWSPWTTYRTGAYRGRC